MPPAGLGSVMSPGRDYGLGLDADEFEVILVLFVSWRNSLCRETQSSCLGG